MKSKKQMIAEVEEKLDSSIYDRNKMKCPSCKIGINEGGGHSNTCFHCNTCDYVECVVTSPMIENDSKYFQYFLDQKKLIEEAVSLARENEEN